MPVTETTVATSGPVFTGWAERVAAEFTEILKERVAKQGKNMVDARLADVLVNPTGYYQSRITVERVQRDWHITDDLVVYGPWLEGVGSRNYPVTRFKGYHTFRWVTQILKKAVPQIAQMELESGRYMERMNGL